MNTMMAELLAFDSMVFNGVLLVAVCIMAVRGWLTKLNAKKKLQAAGKAFSTQIPALDTNQQADEALAVEQFQSIHGLPSYPPPTLWQRVSGSGTPMELLFTRSCLIFCDPSASESSNRTVIPLVDILSCRTDYNNGAALVIKASCGTIRCHTGRTFGARPANKILNDMLRHR
jgi:hypothetical protein